MDPKLAQIYGTVENNESDVETLAAARMAEKLASAEQLDVSGMSDEEAEQLASEILADGSTDSSDEEAAQEEQGEETETQEEASSEDEANEGEPAEEKTASEDSKLTPFQEKVAEADYLGRVMAHALVQERKEIEKAAGAKLDGLKGAAAITAGQAAGKAGKVGNFLKNNKKAVGAAAAGTAAVAGGAMAAKKMMKKKEASAEEQTETQEMSALDRLALARAHEILKENGISEETEKKSSVDEEKTAQLEAKVQARAQELLVEAGYSFEE